MSRITLVYDHAKRKCVEKSRVIARQAGPSVIGDIQDTRSMLDGKVYSSRSHYRTHVKDRGCEIVGNDLNNQSMTRETQEAPGLVADIKRAIGEQS